MSAASRLLTVTKASIVLGPFDDVLTAATIAAAIDNQWKDSPVDVDPHLVVPQEIVLLSDPLNILNVLPQLREEFAQNRPFIEAFDLIESRIQNVSPTVDTGIEDPG